MSGIATYNMLGRNGRLGNCLFQIGATIGYADKNKKGYSFPHWDKEVHFPNLPTSMHFPNFNCDTAEENGFEYQEMHFIEGVVSVEGYRQSIKYFDWCEAEVREILEFSEEVQEKAKEIVKKEFENQKVLAAHFRFGDYVGNSFYTQLWETDYYANAFIEIEKRLNLHEKQKILIFSDDIEKDLMVYQDGQRGR